jgi:hypothetical protein
LKFFEPFFKFFSLNKIETKIYRTDSQPKQIKEKFSMSRFFLTLSLLFLAGVMTANAGTLFKASLSSAQEVPTNNSIGTGFGTVQLNDAGTQATVNLRFTGLTSNQTASHIHGNAAAGTNAPVLFNIGATGGTGGVLPTVTINVTPQQVADLRAGRWYFNVHTANNPGGEIRAQIVSNTLVDFNGDGITDWAVARRNGPISPWTWFVRSNGTENAAGFQFGQSPNDLFQPVDFDGDGKSDIAVWRDNGFYYIINSSNSSFRAVFVGGIRGNSAVSADYDGDGRDDPAVFITPTTTVGQGEWCYIGSLNNPQQTRTCVPWGARYGTQSDQVDDPYPGDFDGDGKADFRVQRRTDTTNGGTTPAIFYTLTATGAISYDYFGLSADRIIPGDYDGDGKTDICVARGFNIGTNPPTPIQFFIRHTNGQPDEYISFGNGSNFNFAQGDYDGDGKDDLAFLVAADDANPARRHFWVRPSANPNQPIIHQWGASGDLPVAGYNNR